MSPVNTLVSVIISVAGLLLPVNAAVIHKWVDADGVTHYSDEAPAATPTPVMRIELPDAPAPDAGDDYYSIANQWARMSAESLRREELRLEAKRLDAARQDVAPQTVYVERPEQKRYSVGHPRFSKRRHHQRRAATKIPGNYPIGLHPDRNLNVGGFNQNY